MTYDEASDLLPVDTRRPAPRTGRIAAILCLGASIVSAGAARAFEEDTHEAITDEALQASALNKNASRSSIWEFHSTARLAIADGNEDVDDEDWGGTLGDTAPQHFDDSRLFEGAEHVYLQRQNVIASLQQAEAAVVAGASDRFADSIAEAHEFLGIAHHAIQDFYSHSNWITLHPNDADIAAMIWLNGAGGNPFNQVVKNQCTCGREVLNNELVTGVFRWPPQRMVAEIQNDFCVHGPARIDAEHPAVGECPVEFSTHPGLEKDKPGTSQRHRDEHAAARARAVVATAAFTHGILREVEDKQLFVALCGFLGYGDARTCLAKSSHDFEIELPFYAFAAGAYRTDEAFSFDIPKFDPELGTLKAMTSTWKFTVEGTAVCPANPGTAIFGADLCVGLRRLGTLGITSTDNIYSSLYCRTNPDLRSSTCGFGGFLPNDFSISYHIWPGGSLPVKIEAEKDFRLMSPVAGWTATASSKSLRVNGTFASRMLLYLGKNNGPGNEPGTYSNSGSYLSFNGAKLKLSLSVQYEYVRKTDDGGGLAVGASR